VGDNGLPGTGAWEGVRTPPPPPTCEPGQRTGPPDFVGVGVQRCGTTRWFDLIAAHPAVSAPASTRKELHFFDRFHLGGFGDAHAAAYHAYFPRRPGQVSGEWTPSYISDLHTTQLLRLAAPETRLLVLVRDPVERYRSAIRRQQRISEGEKLPLHSLAASDALARGLYHQQLCRLTRHFERSRILLLQYERCVRDPAVELGRTFSFLGLDPPREPPDLDHSPNVQRHKPELPEALRGELVAAYRQDVAALASGWPELDLSLWPDFDRL
jgi:hypothetical protein